MAQLVIAAAGAAIGGALAGSGAIFLGMTGAQLGWMAGSMLGSMLIGGQRTSGPRLNDLRVTGSEYGGAIPWVAGAPRVAGELIWASDRREIATTEEVGKGGGSEYTSFSYEIDALYLLADQPGAIVTRCWDNGKLIWTNLASADDASRLASEQADKWARITVYSGGDAQSPDPTYEAAVTNAPGYTRRLTVLIESLQLGSSGTLPNLTFEVVSNGDSSTTFATRHTNTSTGVTFGSPSTVSDGDPGILSMTPDVRVAVQSTTEAVVYRFSLDGARLANGSRESSEPYPSGPGWNGGVFLSNPFSFGVGIAGGLPVRVANHAYAIGSSPYGHQIPVGWQHATTWGIGLAADLASLLPAGRFIGDTIPCSDGMHLLVLTAPTSAFGGASVLDTWHLIEVDGFASRLVSSGPVSPARSWRAVGNAGQRDFQTVVACLEDDLQHVWFAEGSSTRTVYMLKIEADGVLRPRSSVSFAIPTSDSSYPSIWAEGSYCVAVALNTYRAFRRVGDVIGEVTLQDTVAALCDRATMPAGTYDASGLAAITQPVRALAVTNGSARQALEILQSSHGFDAYVTDKLYFVPRGGAPVLTIDADDLAAGDVDAQAEPFALSVNSDLEMPSRIAVVFKNMDADQVTGTEHSERGPTGQDSIQALQLAIGMTPGEAKGVADAVVRDAYAARLTSSISLPMSYTEITPTDVVQVPDSDGTLYRMRVTRRSDSGGVIQLDVVGDDATVTVPADGMATSTDYAPQATVVPLAVTQMELLDIPLLRDVDEAHGLYVATKGSGPRWPGANVLVSANGADYTLAAATPRASVIGTATTALGSWTRGAVMDEINSVTVSVGAGQLASTSRAALLADRTINAILIGNEVIRFTTAALVSSTPNVYTLTRLLRGQLGTEWAQTGHVIGDRVVLLSTALRSIPQQAADVGLPRFYRGVTSGASAASVSPVQFSAASVRKKPYSPANARLAPTGSGTYLVTWERRTRLETVVRDGRGVLVPLGEDSEAYSVDVINASSEILQTLDVTTPQAYIGAPREKLKYTIGLKFPHEWAGDVYAVRVTYGRPTEFVKMAADGSVSAQTPEIPGNLWNAVYTGSGVAYATTTETDASNTLITANRLYRIDLATMTVTASIDFWALSSGTAKSYHLVLDGADLWTVLDVGGILQKHDPTTLAVTLTVALGNTFVSGFSPATLSLGADGAGTLFIANRDYDKLSAYLTTGTPGTVWQVTIPPTIGGISQLYYSGTVLFAAGSQGVGAFDAATGALLFDYGERSKDYGTGAMPLSEFGGSVIYASEIVTEGTGSVSYSIGPVRVLDPASGALLQSFVLPNAFGNVAAIGSLIFATTGDQTSRSFEPIGDLSGGQVMIYQVSATVGRGYPKTINIP